MVQKNLKQKEMGMFQLLSHAQMEAILPATVARHQHSIVLFHLKHENVTQQYLPPLKEVGSAEEIERKGQCHGILSRRD